ncbi:MAG TPA: head GIN domain-containing protein [Telluria sp.]|nr:head GIN domain-containing protein [Telluria sp.]
MRGLIKTGFALLVLAFVLIGISYSMLRANGVRAPGLREGRVIVSDTRAIDKSVRSVDLNGPIVLTLRQGSTPSLVVKGEKRLLGNIDTTVEGENIHIGVSGMLLHHRQPIRVELTLPALENLALNGSSSASVNGFAGEHVQLMLRGSGSIKFNCRYKEVLASLHGSGDMDISSGIVADRIIAEVAGTGTVTLAGTAKEMHVDQTGSGTLDAQHLEADRVSVDQKGSGHASVHARETAVLAVRGSGEIDVYGEPRERTITRTGSGDVNFVR